MPTNESNHVSRNEGNTNDQKLVITLSTVLSVVGVSLIVAIAYLCVRRNRRRTPIFNRGITPIGDDEIATWKVSRTATIEKERYTQRPRHTHNASTSTRKAPSVIQYQNGGRPSLEVGSPRSFISYGKYSLDLPHRPEAVVLARAPNARTGLTDEAIPGDDPFIQTPRRQQSRLYKQPPTPTSQSPRWHGRTRASRSSSLKSSGEAWRMSFDPSPTGSREGTITPSRGQSRFYSSSNVPRQLDFSFSDSPEAFAGLSPPPSRRNDAPSYIGQAIG